MTCSNTMKICRVYKELFLVIAEIPKPCVNNVHDIDMTYMET